MLVFKFQIGQAPPCNRRGTLTLPPVAEGEILMNLSRRMGMSPEKEQREQRCEPAYDASLRQLCGDNTNIWSLVRFQQCTLR